MNYEKIKCGDLIVHEILEPPEERVYHVGKSLGRGYNSQVFIVYLQQEDDAESKLAAKIIRKSTLKLIDEKNLEKEIEIHSRVSHERIIQFYTHFEYLDNVVIVLELGEKNSLFEILKREKKFSDSKTWPMMNQLLEGINYLHDNYIIHRDLKLGNILLDAEDNVKICDLGFATQVAYEGQIFTTLCGTPNYVAPEIIKEIGYSYGVDIWAFGVIFFALLHGAPPFETATIEETYRCIKRISFTFPISFSKRSRDIISSVLQKQKKRVQLRAPLKEN